MKKWRFFCFLLFFIIVFKPVFAQQIRLNFDWAVFQYDQQHLSLEIYYSLLQNEINYTVQNENLIGMTMSRFKAFKDDALVIDHGWKNQNVIQDSASLADPKLIIDRAAFKLEPGNYRFKFILKDLQNSAIGDSLIWSLKLAPPEFQKPCFSNIQLASSIKQDPTAKDSPFYRNTLVIVPHPNLVYSKFNPVLFFYAEAYNLNQVELSTGYYLNYYITDSEGNKIESIKPRKVKKETAVHPSVEFGWLNVGGLPTQTYELHVEIVNLQDNVITSQQKKFYIYQRDEISELAKNETRNTPNNLFLSMDSTQIENEYLMASYLMNQATKSLWTQIKNLDGKKDFLYQFWLSQDPDPATEQNEFRDNYLLRLDYANSAFRAFRCEGWRTDRGRVYMVYGPPSDIDRHPNEPNSHSYEIWNYNELQGGVIFVFADLDGYKNYRLLHSTLTGEIRDYDFMSAIRKGY